MNFLAHLFLSGNSGEIRTGNFIGDYVKGKRYLDYPPLIKTGILMHRKIDSFTDRNEIVKESKRHFAPVYQKYAGVIIDVVYDHFLSAHWEQYSKIPFDTFVYDCYETLLNQYAIMPEKVQAFLPYFVIHSWLESYRSMQGIHSVLQRMSKRTSLPDKSTQAIKILEINYLSLQDDFHRFFHLLIRDIIHDETIKKACPQGNFSNMMP